MKILILGGTGFIGRHLTKFLIENGHLVTALGREAFSSKQRLVEHLNQADLLIMLAGANIGKRWSESYKKTLYDSRIQTNEFLAEALKQCDTPPQRIFSASAIGIYPESNCASPLDESCSEVGEHILADLGQAWEAASLQLEPKPVLMRFGVVLGDGGALEKMRLPFALGLGGPVASGEQCFSWVHIQDLCRAVLFLIERPELTGGFNITSPHPVTNRALGKALARQLNRPFWLPLPAWQLRLMFGEGAAVLTLSSAVLPTYLQKAGFQFEFPLLEDALKQIIHG